MGTASPPVNASPAAVVSTTFTLKRLDRRDLPVSAQNHRALAAEFENDRLWPAAKQAHSDLLGVGDLPRFGRQLKPDHRLGFMLIGREYIERRIALSAAA